MPKNKAFPSLCLALGVAFGFSAYGQGTNLAQGKSVVASSQESVAYAASKAVDGSTATGWASLKGDPQWIRMDLGASYSVARIVLTWGIASAKDYRVEVSSDDISWASVVSRSGMPSGVRTDEFGGLSANGRYLRVVCTARASSANQYSLREIKVYGSRSGASGSGNGGFFLGLDYGMAIPLASSEDFYSYGDSPSVNLGWQFPSQVGRLRLGAEAGAFLLPKGYVESGFIGIHLGAFLGYDLRIAGGLHARAELGCGCSAAFDSSASQAAIQQDAYKPYAGAAAGLGIDLGTGFSISAGARLHAVFPGAVILEIVDLFVSPELGIELRF